MTSSNQSNDSTVVVASRLLCPTNSVTVLHVRVVVYLVTLIAAVVINSLVITIVCKSHRLRNPINYLIVNLAMADLLAPSFAIPRIIAERYDPSWAVKGTFGAFLCKFSSFLLDVPTAVSIQTLVIMTVDRFHAIVFPMRSPLLSPRRCVIAITITWLLAFLLYSPYFYIWRLIQWPTGKNTTIEFCGSSWKPAFDTDTPDKIYYWVVLTIHTAVPLAILATLHILIMTSLIRQEDLQACPQQRKRRCKENRQIWKMLTTIFLVCLVSWVPYRIQGFILYLYDGHLYSCPFRVFRYIAYLLFYSYSAANPCVYFIFIEKYREAFKQLFSFRRRRNSNNGVSESVTLYTTTYSRN